MKPSEVRDSLGDIVVMGGIDPNFIANRPPDEIGEWTRCVLEDMAPAKFVGLLVFTDKNNIELIRSKIS